MSDEVANQTTGPAFALVTSGILDSPEFASLSATAIQVYLQLWRYAGGSRIFPKRTTIARNARILASDGTPDVGQVRRALRRLEACGLVVVTPRAGPCGRSTSNLYSLTDPPSFQGYDRKGRPLFAGDPPHVDHEGGDSAPHGAQDRTPPGAGSAPRLPFARGRRTEPPRSDLIQQHEPSTGSVVAGDDEPESVRGTYRGQRSAAGGVAAWKA